MEDYGDTFKVYYIDEEGVNPLQVEKFNYVDSLTTYYTVKCLVFDRKLIKY